MKYPNSLLFKISGNDLLKPSWLFGTMHMICADDFHIKDKVLKALSKCSRYFMEVDLGSVSEMEMMQSRPATISDISQGLTDRQKEELDKILSEQFGLTLQEASELPPVALINKMTTDAIACEDFKVAEAELLQVAQQAGLKTGGLETALEQLEIATKVFDGRELLHQLKSSGDYKDLFHQMMKAYHDEDLLSLAEFVTDKRFMSRKACNILVTNRNKSWAKMIPGLIRPGSSFIAVGAGHLPGENGLIALLMAQGYSINPVYK